MKITGYRFETNTKHAPAYIDVEVAWRAKHSSYSRNGVNLWATKFQLWRIKRYLNRFTNLDYTLKEID